MNGSRNCKHCENRIYLIENYTLTAMADTSLKDDARQYIPKATVLQ